MGAPLRRIWVGTSVKTTIEIADDLFERAQRLARKEGTTFRALTEQGLRLVLKEGHSHVRKVEVEVPPRSRAEE